MVKREYIYIHRNICRKHRNNEIRNLLAIWATHRERAYMRLTCSNLRTDEVDSQFEEQIAGVGWRGVARGMVYERGSCIQ